VFLSNRLYRKAFSLNQLEGLSRLGNKIYWFDETASTGTTNFEVLPFVDRYLKRQLLRDTTQYYEAWYRRRIYADYYHRRFGLTDPDEHYTETPLTPDYAHKLGVYWNLAYKDYRSYLRPLQPITRRLAPLSLLSPRFLPPSSPRDIDVFARMSLDAFPPSVSYQRREIVRLLEGLDSASVKFAYRGTVPKTQYNRELTGSRTVVSPFGFGEICYRDFEAMLNGACLIKPDVSHLATWPDAFIPNQTYIPFRWDFSDFKDTLQRALSGDSALQVACAAQQTLKEHIGHAGASRFVERLHAILGVSQDA
jgi:hypothetical protein